MEKKEKIMLFLILLGIMSIHYLTAKALYNNSIDWLTGYFIHAGTTVITLLFVMRVTKE